VIDCDEWKTEKRHECTNMGKVKRLELWRQLYVTWLPRRDVRNIRPMDFCSTECTNKQRPSYTIFAGLKSGLFGNWWDRTRFLRLQQSDKTER